MRGRQQIKAVVKKCHLCKVLLEGPPLEGLAYPAPVTSELPGFRLDGGRAFKYTHFFISNPIFELSFYQNSQNEPQSCYEVAKYF